MSVIKSESRVMTSSYRKLTAAKITSSSTVSASQFAEYYRGLESCTSARRKQRLVTNSLVIYASYRGYKPDEVAKIYQQCNTWSNKVAFLQAIHDYSTVYNKIGTDMEQLVLPSVAA